MKDVAAEIERILTERLSPCALEIRDDSAKHVGHPGATSGGGHFHVRIVSEAFRGRTLLERHRMVNDALREMFGPQIHALGLTTLAPGE